MGRWSKPRLAREQTFLFAPTLDEVIPEDDPVRLYHEVLSLFDWSEWEAHYDLYRGQPAIHPRLLVGLILYGLRLGIRSSRKLEDAARNRLDLMWLLEGRQPDHTTIATFRTRFAAELKQLGRQLVAWLAAAEEVDPGLVAVDGTRVAANNSAGRVATAATLEQKIAAEQEAIERGLSELAVNDAAEAGQGSLTVLPPGLQRRAERLARLEVARQAAVAQAAAAAQRQAAKGSAKQGEEPPRRAVPTTDPEARRLPNKDGGCRPNYTPVVATEGRHGFIVDEVVNGTGDEVSELLGVTARVQALREELSEETSEPLCVLADGAYQTGYHLQEATRLGLDLVGPLAGVSQSLPAEVPQAKAGEPLGESCLAELPNNPSTKRWDRRCFAYDAARDVYYCPLGEELRFEETVRVQRSEGLVPERVYRCHRCAGCLWRERCVTSRNKQGRTIHRSSYEPYQECQRAKMQTAEAQAAYRRRGPLVETVFGVVKAQFGVRQFLLRGREKVSLEWRWVCLAYNVRKLVNLLRAGQLQLPV